MTLPDGVFLKDPDAVLDYAFDWSSWLETGVIISSYEITVSTGIVLDSDSESDGIITFWLSGGTLLEYYTVTCEITTSDGQTDERTIIILIRDR